MSYRTPGIFYGGPLLEQEYHYYLSELGMRQLANGLDVSQLFSEDLRALLVTREMLVGVYVEQVLHMDFFLSCFHY
jgi:hypothetical protein